MSQSDTITEQTAARAEAARISDRRQAIDTMRKLARPLEAPDPVPVIDHKMDQLDIAYRRDWEEFLHEAAVVYVESMATLQDARVESVRVDEAKVGHPV